jgi:hypothetical protein
VLDLSDKVKILELLKASMALVEVGTIMGKTNQASAAF